MSGAEPRPLGSNPVERWARAPAGKEQPAVPAATAVLVRDGGEGIEALMVRRSSKLAFAGGMWVFPGGRVDPEDHPDDTAEGSLAAAKRAAVREVLEESGLAVDEAGLVPFSHWTPPPITPRRFATWFFIAAAPEGSVTVDGAEIRDHAWMQPASALARRDAGEIELAPPTWISLWRLAGYADVRRALEDSLRRQPEVFETHIALVDGGAVALYAGDAGYEVSDPALPGRRHRLVMLEAGWHYEVSLAEHPTEDAGPAGSSGAPPPGDTA